MDSQRRTAPMLLKCLVVPVLVAGISTTSAAGVTYTVDRSVGPGRITGTIVTDGATGVLTSADILDWNLNVDADGDPATSGQLLGPLSGNNSSITALSGSPLTATPTAMFFDFSLPGPATPILQIATPDSNVVWQLQAGIFSDELIRESLSPTLIQAFVTRPPSQDQIASAAAVPPPPSGHTVHLLPLPPGSGGGAATSINKMGQIVGSFLTPCPVCSLAALWEGPNATTPMVLAVPSGPFPGSNASSINDKGEIVGTIEPPPPGLVLPLPTFWSGADANAPTVLPFPPMPPGPFGTGGGAAASINKKGQIVGSVFTSGGSFFPTSLPAFWEGPDAEAATILPLPSLPPGPLGSGGGQAKSINKKGQIVGSVRSSSGSFFASSVPAFWDSPDATAPTILPFPPLPTGPFGSGGGAATSINEKGQIVGYVFQAGSFPPFFPTAVPAFWEGPDALAATILPFPPVPGAFGGSSASSINNDGKIVGTVFQAGSPFPTQVPAFWVGPDATAATILPSPHAVPGPLSGRAFAINNKGQIVGDVQSIFGSGGAQPVLWAKE